MDGKKLTRTRRALAQITEIRCNTEQEGTSANSRRNESGSSRRRAKKHPKREKNISRQTQRVVSKQRKNSTKSRSHVSNIAVVPQHDKRFQHASYAKVNAVTRQLFNRNQVKFTQKAGENGIIHNYVDENSFNEVKPPMLSQGVDRWGPHTVIVGSESISPVEVRTTTPANVAEDNQTEVGDTIA